MTIVKFFDIPFGTGGTQTPIPDGTQSGGEVSFTQGYGPDYSLAPGTSGVLYPESGEFNYLMFAITSALNMYQTHAFPDFISSAVNGGSPYSYDINSYVRWTDGNIYYSLINANTTTPATTANWALLVAPQAIPTGTCWEFYGTTLPSGGWIWPDGGSIGNASSNATNTANVSTLNLFTQIWNQFPNTIAQLYNSSGSPISRGSTAAADWAANNAIKILDRRGYVAAGWQLMNSGTSPELLSLENTQGINGDILGETGGEQSHVDVIAEMPSHTHFAFNNNYGSPASVTEMSTTNYPAAENSIGGGGNIDIHGLASQSNVGLTSANGGGGPHNNVQPTVIMNYILKL